MLGEGRAGRTASKSGHPCPWPVYFKTGGLCPCLSILKQAGFVPVHGLSILKQAGFVPAHGLSILKQAGFVPAHGLSILKQAGFVSAQGLSILN